MGLFINSSPTLVIYLENNCDHSFYSSAHTLLTGHLRLVGNHSKIWEFTEAFNRQASVLVSRMFCVISASDPFPFPFQITSRSSFRSFHYFTYTLICLQFPNVSLNFPSLGKHSEKGISVYFHLELFVIIELKFVCFFGGRALYSNVYTEKEK